MNEDSLRGSFLYCTFSKLKANQTGWGSAKLVPEAEFINAQFQITFAQGGGGGVKSVSRGDFLKSTEENS
jgi:hypothetical protein